MTQFATPGTSTGGLQLANHVGALLLIEVESHEREIPTTFGVKDAIRANVTVIDGDGAPAEYDDTLVFGGVLIGQLKSRVGQKVLGRLTRGDAKPGQQAPWKLAEASEADVKKASEFVAKAAASSNEAPF